MKSPVNRPMPFRLSFCFNNNSPRLLAASLLVCGVLSFAIVQRDAYAAPGEDPKADRLCQEALHELKVPLAPIKKLLIQTGNMDYGQAWRRLGASCQSVSCESLLASRLFESMEFADTRYSVPAMTSLLLGRKCKDQIVEFLLSKGMKVRKRFSTPSHLQFSYTDDRVPWYKNIPFSANFYLFLVKFDQDGSLVFFSGSRESF